MHTKREIEKLLQKVLFEECVVRCVKLDEKDIHKYILSSKKNKDNYSDEPPKKIPKMDTNRRGDTEKVLIEIDDKELTESSNSSANNVFKKTKVVDSKKTMSASKPKRKIASTRTEAIPIEAVYEKSTKSSNSSVHFGIDNNQVVNFRKTRSSSANDVLKKNKVVYIKKTTCASKPKHEIASTNTEEIPIEIGDKKPTKSSMSSANNVFKKNKVVDCRKTMSASKLKHKIASTSIEAIPIEAVYEESTKSSNSSANFGIDNNQVVSSRKTRYSSTNDVFKRNKVVYTKKTMCASKLKHEIAPTSTDDLLIEIDDEEPTESSKSSANNVFKKHKVVDPRKTMSASKLKHKIASTSIEAIPIEAVYEESTKSSNSSAHFGIDNNQVVNCRKTRSSSANDVLKKNKVVYIKKTMCASKPKHEIASTNTEEIPIEIGDKKPTKSSMSSANNVFKKNKVVDCRKTMSASKLKHKIASTSIEAIPIEAVYEESTKSSNSSANFGIDNNQVVVRSRKTRYSSTNDVFKRNKVVYPKKTMCASKLKHEIAPTSIEEVPIEIDDEELMESVNYVIKKNQIIDPRKTVSSSSSENEKASTSIEEVPIEIDDEEPTESSNSSAYYVFKKNQIIDPRKTMSALKPKHKIASTSIEEVPIEIDGEELMESANYVLKKNQIIDPRKTMSSSNSENEIASTSIEEVPIEIDDKELMESANYVLKKNQIIDPRKTMSSSNSENEIASTSIKEVPIEIDNEELMESANYVLKKNQIIDPRKTMSLSNSENEIASTSIEDLLIEIDDEEPTESSNSSYVLPKISVIDPRKMMDDDKYILFKKVFLDKKPNSTNVKSVKSALNENFNLIEIEKLYNKYYSKFVQDTIAVIANLYIIYATTYIQYIEQIKKSFENTNEAKKLKETYDAKLLHERQTKILERKVKINLTNVVSLFFETEFEKAFKMFFLSILNVVRILKQPKFWKGEMFKHLSQFLLNCLNNDEYNDFRVFSMLQSNDFQLDCLNMMLEIEDSKDNDPGVTDRLTLFFLTSVNSQKYFQKIVDAIVSESDVDLEILIDEASFQCCVNSIFKDPVYSSTVQESNDELPETNTIQNPINCSEQIKHCVIPKSPDGTFQGIPGSQTIGNTAVEMPTVTNQESSTQEVSNETYTPKAISIKKCIVVTPNNSIVHGKTSLSATLTQPTHVRSIQNENTMAFRHRAEGLNIGVLDQQDGPLSQLKKSHIIVRNNDLLVKLPLIKCFVKNCNKAVNLMCSNCKVVKYCSRRCQKRHWYLNHINHCDQMLNKRI